MNVNFSLLRNAFQELRAYLGSYPAECEELSQLWQQLEAEDADLLSRKGMRGHLTASGLVLNAAGSHVLFVHHKAHNMWLQAGGHYDVGEDANLLATALREVWEETGVKATLHPLQQARAYPFDIHTHAIASRPEKGEGNHWHHDYCYLLVADEQDLTAQASEVLGARWIPLGELATLQGLRLSGRFLPKLKALSLY